MKDIRIKELYAKITQPFDKRIRFKHITQDEFFNLLFSPKRRNSPRYQIIDTADGRLILKETPLRNVV